MPAARVGRSWCRAFTCSGIRIDRLAEHFFNLRVYTGDEDDTFTSRGLFGTTSRITSLSLGEVVLIQFEAISEN